VTTTPPAPPSGGQPQNDPLAIWSLVLGIAGLVACPLVPSIIAIILGGKSKRKIAESGGTLTGESMAKVGVILGWIGIALGILAIIVAVLISIGTFAVMNATTSMN
jgi:hypothetical protein